nr:MAG TPA: hypothetical protein [Caudoviricetes sp.]
MMGGVSIISGTQKECVESLFLPIDKLMFYYSLKLF